uniref:Replication-associated protein n=1 Tax=Genomoviridae sp. TaxID=2202565 RepID=A0A858NFX3_9VIRU|nr:MAG: replication-associated protein [Genomoviridae sp.]
MSAFIFRSRYALLTYAQCGDLDPWSVSNLLSEVPAECIIGREDHADGGVHLHVFVDFGTRFCTKDPRRFDVDGHHPNIQPCGRTPAKMYDYAIKDGDVVAGGLDRPGGDDVAGVCSQWDRIVDAQDAEEFWDLVRTLAPRVLVTNFNSLRSYCEWRYRPTVADYITPPGIVFDLSGVEELGEFVRESLSGNWVGKPKSLIIHGETRLGKTLWARSLGEHIYCCLQFNVDDVRAKLEVAKYAVFDDMQGGFKYFPSYKGWLGAQKSFTVTDKYKGKTTIEWGRPTIWVMNESPSSCTDVDYEWLMGNCFIVHVGHAIFHAST